MNYWTNHDLTQGSGILPKEAELLGANSEELEITGSGAHTAVRLNKDGHRYLVASLANTSENTSGDQVYLMLENIKGTHDATVLSVYINLPEGAAQDDYRNLLAGSVGLYGLRRASIPHGDHGGLGLTFVLDITRILFEQRVANSPYGDEIRVNIVPHRQLPDHAEVLVGRISIFRQRHSV